MITSPGSLTIPANASNVDAGNFVVNWSNNTDNLLISLSLDYHSSATLSFPTNTGLTRNYGYNSWTNVTSIVFYGTRDNVNTALAAMTISMGSLKTSIRINIEVSTYDANYYYNPINKHFYRYVSGAVSYSTAKTGAASYSFKGKTGYLVTVTSQSESGFINNNISGNNIWIALADANSEGTWYIDDGPEKDRIIWKTSVSGITNSTTASYSSSGTSQGGFFTNWCSGEPNNADGSRSGEDYAVTKWGGGTCWNDLAGTNTGSVGGYVVEISDDYPAGSDYSGVYTSYVIHNNDAAYSLTSGNSSSSSVWSNPNAMPLGLYINSTHTITVPANTNIYSGTVTLNGNGKLAFSNSNSKWYPTPTLKSCNEILSYFPLATSGVYTIDPDGSGSLPSTSCYCDMSTDGGGWTLVLNYLHKATTNPVLSVKTNSLPLLGATTLGLDESTSSTTWGHISNSYLNSFTFTQIRFYAKTSAHSRIIHFKTSHSNTINYFKSGSGSMTGISSSFTSLTGHSAYLPNSATSFFSEQGNNAMTNFPFWLGGTYHWGIRGLDYRWEVDDFPANTGTGYQNDTFHQIWVK